MVRVDFMLVREATSRCDSREVREGLLGMCSIIGVALVMTCEVGTLWSLLLVLFYQLLHYYSNIVQFLVTTTDYLAKYLDASFNDCDVGLSVYVVPCVCTVLSVSVAW